MERLIEGTKMLQKTRGVSSNETPKKARETETIRSIKDLNRQYKQTPRQEFLLPILAAGRTVAEASRITGTPRSTIYRWLKEPYFFAELNRRKQAAGEQHQGAEITPEQIAELQVQVDEVVRRFRVRFGKHHQ
jgi:hypothetical protein